jgi:multidrug efflux pump subunit AcrA (membrane-fusion protein)
MNKKKILLPVFLLVLGVGGFAMLKATRLKPPVTASKEPMWRVQTVTAQPAAISPVTALNGRVESPELMRAAAPGVGRVLQISVREGQIVSPGQRLLELDPRDFQPRVDQARGEVDELEAAIASEQLRHKADVDQLAQERQLLDFAAADVGRFEQLRKENFYSQSAVDQSRQNLVRQQITFRTRELAIADHKARMGQLQARLSKARANLDQAVLALQRSRIVAPFQGFVAKVEAAVGDQVNSGQSLITLYPAAGLEVRAKLPATQQDAFVTALRRGERAKAVARVAGELIEFELVRSAGAADTRGLDAFFVARRPSASLRVGELVSLQVARTPIADAVAVPYSALFGGQQIYRIEGGRLKAITVELLGDAGDGQGGPSLLVKSSLLKQGDLLLATHLPNAVSGLKVEVMK